jgi:hypothetical protein
MTYGFLVNNNSGFKQFDDTFSSYRLLGSGVGSSGAVISFSGANGGPALILIRPTAYGQWVGAQMYKTQNTSFKCHVWSKTVNSGYSFFTPTSGTFNYQIYVANRDFPTAASGYGLFINSPTGERVLDTKFPPLRIDSVGYHTSSLGGATTINLASSPFNRYAALNSTGCTDLFLGGVIGVVFTFTSNNSCVYEVGTFMLPSSGGNFVYDIATPDYQSFMLSVDPVLIGGY